MAISSAEPRLLCVAPNWLGDAILARAALALLGRAGAHVDVWARGRVGRVVADLPGVRAVLRQPEPRLARFRTAWSLRSRGYDAVLVLPPSWSSAWAGWILHAPVRVGFATAGRRAGLTHAVAAPGRATHLQTQYVMLASVLLGACGRPVPALPGPVPDLRAAADELAAASAARAAAGVHGPYAVLAPGARYGPAKKWPAERFAAVAAHLRNTYGWTVVLAGEPGDAADTAAVRAIEPRAVDCAGRTSLPALVGLLAGARAVVANDSGTMHLAAALGRPVVGIFGSTSPEWTGPVGCAAGALVWAPWCAPCFARTCAQDFACMLRITPESVVEKLAALMAAAHEAEPG